MTATNTQERQKRENFGRALRRLGLYLPTIATMVVASRSAPLPNQFKPEQSQPGYSQTIKGGVMDQQTAGSVIKAPVNNNGVVSAIDRSSKTGLKIRRRNQNITVSSLNSNRIRIQRGDNHDKITVSNNFRPSQVIYHSAAPLLNHDVLVGNKEIKERNREHTVLSGIQNIISLMKGFGIRGEALMLEAALENLSRVPREARGQYLSGIQTQAIEKITETILSTVSVGDLEKLIHNDFSSVPQLKDFAGLVNQDQIAAINLISEGVTNQLIKDNGVFNWDSIEEVIGNIFDGLKGFDVKDLNKLSTPLAMVFTMPTVLAFLKQRNIIDDRKEKQINTYWEKNKRTITSVISAAVVLTSIACVIAGIAITATPTQPIDVTQTPIAQTFTPSPESVVPSPSAEINQTLPPIFTNIYLGESTGYGESILYGGAQVVGGINGDLVSRNNPNVHVPLVDGINECQINVLYNRNFPNSIAAMQIDQTWLANVFNVPIDQLRQPVKGSSVIGNLPDGSPVQYENGFWFILKNGEKQFLNPIIANLSGRPFGYPCLVQDSSGNYFIGLLDDNGRLIENSKFESAFKSVKDIAKLLGYSGDLNKITSIGYDDNGNIQLLDANGKVITTLPYLNTSLLAIDTLTPSPFPTLIEPTATLTAVPTEAVQFNLPIEKNFEPSKFNQLAEITPEEATSTAFDAFLDQQEAAGQLNDFVDVRYLEGYGFGSGKWVPRTSLDRPHSILEVENQELRNGTFGELLRRPMVDQAYFRTKINNANYLLIIKKMYNNDGTEVRLKIVVPEQYAENNWSEYLNPSNGFYVTLPKQWPDNIDPYIAPQAHDANYYINYWKFHSQEMNYLINNMVNGNMQFSKEWSNFLWEGSTILIRPK